jgi:hypothetical protein
MIFVRNLAPRLDSRGPATSDISVSTVDVRRGINHLGRFSRDYQLRFDELRPQRSDADERSPTPMPDLGHLDAQRGAGSDYLYAQRRNSDHTLRP